MSRERTILLVNGFPGFWTNFDLAQALRRRPARVARFSYASALAAGACAEPAFSFGAAEDALASVIRSLLLRDELGGIVAYCFGGWLVARAIEMAPVPDDLPVVYLAPLLSPRAYRARYDRMNTPLLEYLFKPALALLPGDPDCWDDEWRRLEASPVPLVHRTRNAVVLAQGDGELDEVSAQLAHTLAPVDRTAVLPTREHYFTDCRAALRDSVCAFLDPGGTVA
jgi:hypothetical protein